MKTKTMDGNEAVARSAYLFTELAGIYPITPSSPMAEHIDIWSKEKVNLFGNPVKVVEMQSEAGAAGFLHGSLQAGTFTTTFTSSQGLLLMIPNMYKISGEMLPAVFHVAARSLSTHALSILGDHQDIYAVRSTGFCMLASASVQEASDLAIVTHLSAIKGSLPFLHFFDGFRTSHELQKISYLESDDVKDLLDEKSIQKFRHNALNLDHKVTRGMAQNDDVYFQVTEARNSFYQEIPEIVNHYMEEIGKISGRVYHPFDYYGDEEAEKVIVAMGSVCETIKETIDDLHKKGYSVGLINVHLYRPFSTKYLFQVLPKTVQKIAVLDRTKEPGSLGEPLYLDVVSALKETDIQIVGGRYGLSSKNTTPAMIKAVYDMLDHPKENFTIGIEDDVTHTSLSYDKTYKISDSEEYLIYGYGSDGMVSASKSIIGLLGDNTNSYVQGYFQYDSKKSGGVTKSHLRVNEKPIRSTYYVENPSMIVITKDRYLNDFDTLSNLKEDGIVIINTTQKEEEFISNLSEKNKHILLEKNANLYLINAYELAHKVGLKNKISMIMESAIMSLSTKIPYEVSKEKMKEYAKKKFFKKGSEVYLANEKGIEEAPSYLRKITLEEEIYMEEEEPEKDLFSIIRERKGDSIPTSKFLSIADGSFESGTSKREKRSISELVPQWVSSNCIQCNQCSLVCPHGVIRPYLLSKEEYESSPDYIQKRCQKPLEKNLQDYYFILGISVKDCTGCKLCLKNCPGLKGMKALLSKPFEENIEEQKVFDYLESHIKSKKKHPLYTVKGSQFEEPKFAFSGACAGCGETPYIKLLTQLFGDHMIIANATGCSSIYGGSMPSTPYTIPWASSLFEDNAEYGYGMLVGNNVMRSRIQSILEKNLDSEYGSLYQEWLDNKEDYEKTKAIYNQIDFTKVPKELADLKDYFIARNIWTIGGDGWAYDIGFGGIDHVLSSNENVNILVLNSEVYSNTGGQASKASPKGSVEPFASSGKEYEKKDLAKMLMAYPHVYVAQISLGANKAQAIKAMEEAAHYPGPSILIAYASCIAHGMNGGMENSMEEEKEATECGYFPIFRYHPETKKFTLDSKNVNFDLYEDFLMKQTRYAMLKEINPEKAQALLEENKKHAMERYQYYQKLQEE